MAHPAKLNAIYQKCPQLKQTPSPEGEVDVLETLGKGNYGYVYKGRLRSMEKLSAVKVVYLKESELREILLEVEILKECNHANIVQHYATYMQGMDLWICMEYCGGGSVDSIYAALPKPLSDDAIAVIMYESLQGLAYFHKTNHIHRDIKAGNLLLTESGEVKLADFGVSAKLSSRQPLAHSFIGTPYWMAPEVILSDNDRNNLYDCKVDIWSIGITAIELADKAPPLADIHPFTALKLILQDNTQLGLKNPKKRPKQFVDFINACLTRDPRKRPSAEELLKHPFFAKIPQIKGNQMLADLVTKAQTFRQKKKAGVMVYDDDDDDDPSRYEIAPAQTKVEKAEPTPVAITPVVVQKTQAQIMPPEATVGRAIIEAKQSYILDEEILCADFLGPYLLLGTEKGLLVADLSQPDFQAFTFCIRGVRFRQISILEDYGVMMARCGKNDHVRQYRLSSLKKCCKTVFGGETQDSPSTPSRDEGMFSFGSKSVSNTGSPSDDFIKIPSTKDSTNFMTERTAGSIFMLVLFRQDITLFEWAKEPYSRFMKVKSFWLPETPRFMSMFHDGYFIREVLLGYTNEANIVNVEDAKVQEIQVHKDFSSGGVPRDERWRTYDQLPLDQSLYATIKANDVRQATVNRKVLAAVSPYQNQQGSANLHLRRFLATFGKRTKIVDMSGNPIPNTPTFTWSSYPSKLLVVPGMYVIGICETSVEVCNIKSGEQLQVIQHSAQLKFLTDKNGKLCIATQKKRKSHQVFILGAAAQLLESLQSLAQSQSSTETVTAQNQSSIVSQPGKASPNSVSNIQKSLSSTSISGHAQNQSGSSPTSHTVPSPYSAPPRTSSSPQARSPQPQRAAQPSQISHPPQQPQHQHAYQPVQHQQHPVHYAQAPQIQHPQRTSSAQHAHMQHVQIPVQFPQIQMAQAYPPVQHPPQPQQGHPPQSGHYGQPHGHQ